MKTTIIETECGSVDFDIYTEEVFDDEGNELEGVDYVRIDNLFVKPEFRGNGYARKLMDLAIATIKAENPSLDIKIVAEPKEEEVEIDRLIEFYESFDIEVVAV